MKALLLGLIIFSLGGSASASPLKLEFETPRKALLKIAKKFEVTNQQKIKLRETYIECRQYTSQSNAARNCYLDKVSGFNSKFFNIVSKACNSHFYNIYITDCFERVIFLAVDNDILINVEKADTIAFSVYSDFLCNVKTPLISYSTECFVTVLREGLSNLQEDELLWEVNKCYLGDGNYKTRCIREILNLNSIYRSS